MLELAPRPLWWLPTLGFFLFLSIELGMFLTPDALFSDPGVARHLRTAESIFATHQVPRTDPLSFTHAGQPWIDYEWAFESTLGELRRLGGLGLICAFCTALFAATNLGIYRTLLHSGFSMTSVVLVTTLAFLTLHLHFAARPVLFTYLFMALVLEVWQRHREPLLRDWILLPLVFVAWANLHAGWAAALIFLLLATTGRIINRALKRMDGIEAPVIPWLMMIVLCFLATLINPWGFALHRHIYLLATTYKSFALWDEYAEPNFNQPSISAITVLILLLVVLLSRAVRRAPLWSWEMILPVFFFLYEGLKAQRHVILLMEVSAVPLARDLDVLLHGTWLPFIRDRLRQFQARQRLAEGDVLYSILCAVLLTALFVHTPAGRKIEVGKSITPALVSFVRDHPDQFRRPLVTTWNAGPLLWDLRPHFRVSFDDRGDFYGDAVVFSFVDLYHGSPGWSETLARNNFDSAILDPYLPLVQLLRLRPDWKEVYHDAKTVVFWRSPASPVSGQK